MIVILIAITGMLLSACTGRDIQIDESSETSGTVSDNHTEANVPDERNKYDWQYDYDFEYNTVEIEGDYIFNCSSVHGYNLIFKRDVHTGEYTNICSDPFCRHDNAECPYFGTYSVTGIGNTMYGIMYDDNINKSVLYSYNAVTEEKKNVVETSAIISELFSYGPFVFYRQIDTGFHRMNTTTGEIEKVKTNSGSLFMIRWNMLIWVQMDKTTGEIKGYTATDLSGENARPYDPKIYKGKLHKSLSTNGIYTTVLQLDKDGNTEKTIVDKGRFPTIIGDKMIYLGVFPDGVPHQRDPENSEEGETVVTGDIYIVSIDNGDSKLLCHIDGIEPYAFGSSENTMICGDWIGIYAVPNKVALETEGVNSDVIIVNMKTGEYHISRYIE